MVMRSCMAHLGHGLHPLISSLSFLMGEMYLGAGISGQRTGLGRTPFGARESSTSLSNPLFLSSSFCIFVAVSGEVRAGKRKGERGGEEEEEQRVGSFDAQVCGPHLPSSPSISFIFFFFRHSYEMRGVWDTVLAKGQP